jgi:hypothetical protein
MERDLAAKTASAKEAAARRAAEKVAAAKEEDLPANAGEVAEKLRKQQARVEMAAAQGLGAMRGFLSTATKIAGIDASTVLGAPDAGDGSGVDGSNAEAAPAKEALAVAEESASDGAASAEAMSGVEVLLGGDSGDVWDEVESRWMSSEEAARREVARAQAWAEDVTKDHLTWYLTQFPSASYEEWVAAFAPENARDYLAGTSADVDHRFYFPSATHLRLWNDAIQSRDAKGHHRMVAPRKTLPASVTK